MFNQERARLLEMLEQDGDRHLVIVRYRPDHLVRCEWVYNRADIDTATVVWAREMDPEHNRELLDYYPGSAHLALGAGRGAADTTPLSKPERPCRADRLESGWPRRAQPSLGMRRAQWEWPERWP